MSEPISPENHELAVRTPTPELTFWPFSDRPQWNFRYSGLGAQIEPNSVEKKVWTFDKSELFIPRGSIVSYLDFLPYGNKEYISGTRKDTMKVGVAALNEFFNCIGSVDPNFPDKPLPEPKYLLGITNPQMANFIQRLGFKTIDHISGWGRIDLRNEGELALIAQTATVRNLFEKIKKDHSWLEDN